LNQQNDQSKKYIVLDILMANVQLMHKYDSINRW
jgi:hypothetical protein